VRGGDGDGEEGRRGLPAPLRFRCLGARGAPSLTADPRSPLLSSRPQEFAKRAAAVCGKPTAELAKQYSLQEAHAPFFCLDLSFCHTVLAQGFDLPEAAPLTLVKQVK
jgi:hypothetical protein